MAFKQVKVSFCEKTTKCFTMFIELKPGRNGFKVHQEIHRSDIRKIIHNFV